MKLFFELLNYKKIKSLKGQMQSGNLYFVLGGNEVGKTSFLRALGTLLTADNRNKHPISFGEDKCVLLSDIDFESPNKEKYTVKFEMDEKKESFLMIKPDGKATTSKNEIRDIFKFNDFTIDNLFDAMKLWFPDEVVVIHSNLAQTARINSLKQFHEGTKRVLIATDIVARGLDISDVTHVINFDTPDTPEDYIHRIGRTGRANKAGTAITFINETEQVCQVAIETMMNKAIPYESLPEEVVISKVLTDDEIPKMIDKIKQKKGKDTYVPGPAFHEKKLKNQKVNLGGPGRKEKLKGKDAKIRTYRRN